MACAHPRNQRKPRVFGEKRKYKGEEATSTYLEKGGGNHVLGGEHGQVGQIVRGVVGVVKGGPPSNG